MNLPDDAQNSEYLPGAGNFISFTQPPPSLSEAQDGEPRQRHTGDLPAKSLMHSLARPSLSCDGAAICGQQGINGWLPPASDFIHSHPIAVRCETARGRKPVNDTGDQDENQTYHGDGLSVKFTRCRS